MADNSPQGLPIALAEDENSYLQQAMVLFRNGGNVMGHPDAAELALSILGKCEAASYLGYAPISFTENENEFLQTYLQQIINDRIDIRHPTELNTIKDIKYKLEADTYTS